MRILGLVIAWGGGLYGIVRGCLLAFQPLSTTASSIAQPQIASDTPSLAESSSTVLTYPEPVLAITMVIAVLLTLGGVLALLILRKTELFVLYAYTLFALSLLSLPSFGWIFLPATALFMVAALLYLIPGAGPHARGAAPVSHR